MLKYAYRNLVIILFIDSFFIAISLYFAYLIRFDFNIPDQYFHNFVGLVPFVLPIKLAVFYCFKVYQGMWRYTSITDLLNIIKSVLVSSLILVCIVLYKSRFVGFPRSVFIIDAAFNLIFIGGFRLFIRMFLTSNTHAVYQKGQNKNDVKKMIVIGAGDAGEKVVREIQDNPRMGYTVVGFLDDDKRKLGKQIHGVKVLGRIDKLNHIVADKGVNEILIAAPSVAGNEIRRIMGLCGLINIPYKTLPGMGELIDGNVSIKKIRDISYKDLLGRKSVALENEKISEFLEDKCIMVTGAGGSIGSELCRQICKFRPAYLILFDSSESNLYSIQMELKHVVTYVKYRAVLGRVQDEKLLDRIMQKYRPHVIFHAAAYKHVPLVERNPWEAVFSNIVGTHTIVKTAIKHRVDRFVLISTDKAVRPTNIMGASKRITERIVQSLPDGPTKFMAVRFGNVIGSAGSVIPLFFRQIENGGPITVTHPEITRYFMTIEEAAQLVLQAFTMGKGREIFILEMGTPIKIVDMAKDLIRLAGKKYESEIEIKFTGLRPGEKLYEELITEGEGIVKTNHKQIMVLKNGEHESLGADWLEEKILELVEIAKSHDADKIKCAIKEIVPEYTMSDDECVI